MLCRCNHILCILLGLTFLLSPLLLRFMQVLIPITYSFYLSIIPCRYHSWYLLKPFTHWRTSKWFLGWFFFFAIIIKPVRNICVQGFFFSFYHPMLVILSQTIPSTCSWPNTPLCLPVAAGTGVWSVFQGLKDGRQRRGQAVVIVLPPVFDTTFASLSAPLSSCWLTNAPDLLIHRGNYFAWLNVPQQSCGLRINL